MKTNHDNHKRNTTSRRARRPLRPLLSINVADALHDRRVRAGIDAQLCTHPLQRWATSYAAAVLPAAALQLDQLCARSVDSDAAIASDARSNGRHDDGATSTPTACASNAQCSGTSRLLSVDRRWEESFGNSNAWQFLAGLPPDDDDEHAPPRPDAARPDGTLPRGSTLSMDLAPNGSELSSGHGDHSVRVWTITQHGARLRHTMAGHARTPCCVRYHPLLPHLLASADLAGRVAVWDTDAGIMLGSFHCAAPAQSAVQERVASISWFPSASRLCLGFVCGRRCFLWMLLGAEGDQAQQRQPIDDNPAAANAVSSPAPAPASASRSNRKRDRNPLSASHSPANTPRNDKRAKHSPTGAGSNERDGTAALLDSAAFFSSSPPESEPTWPELSARLRSSLDAAQPPRPVCILKAKDSFRYICFPPRGDLLLLAESVPATAAEAASARTIDYKRHNPHSFTMRVFGLDDGGVALDAVAAAAVSAHAASASSPSSGSASPSPSTPRAKVSLRVLAAIPRLLFFSESGVAVNEHRMAACQWHATTADGDTSTAASDSDTVAPASLCLRPTLGLFDLRPSAGSGLSLGRCVARASLDSGSFADLTCVSFTSARGDLAHVAVAYQISGQRRQRRDRLGHAIAGSGLLPLSSRSIGAGGVDLQRPTSTPLSSSSRSARPGPRAFSRSRSSALSLLTQSRDDSDVDDEEADRQGSARLSATASSTAASAAPSSAIVATAAAASLQRVVAALDDQTFLSFHSGRDLSLLQQLTAPTAPAARASLLSANVLLAHPDPHVGVMSGSVNGDIHVFAPAVHHAAAAERPGHEQQRADSAYRQQSAPLFGRHRLTPAMRAMLAKSARAL